MEDLKKRNEKLYEMLAPRPDCPLAAFRAEFIDLHLAVRVIAKNEDPSWLILLTMGVSFVWMPMIQHFIQQEDAWQHPSKKMSDIQKLLLAKNVSEHESSNTLNID